MHKFKKHLITQVLNQKIAKMDKQLFIFFTIFLILILLSLLNSSVKTFSDEVSNQGLYAAREVESETKKSSLKGDMIIFPGDSNIQPVSPHKEKKFK